MTQADHKPASNMHRAVQELRALIFSGQLSPGSDHLESELALRLGMSRTPVREAALVLESQGLLEMRPRKGVRILPISAADMADIYDVLTALESRAAERAATAGYDAAALAHLARTIDMMEQAVQANDRPAWADADDAFHRELVRLGGNSRIIALVGMMSDQVRRARAVTLFIRPMPTQSNADHRRVLDAIRAHDPDTARRVHEAHRQAARTMLVGLLETHRLQLL